MSGGPALPDAIKVGPYTYTVHHGGSEHDAKMISERSPDLMGHTDTTAQTITLRADLKPDCLRETMLHEVMHACDFASGEMLAADLSSDADRAEHAIRTLSPWVFSVLRDNPTLTAWLFEDQP